MGRRESQNQMVEMRNSVRAQVREGRLSPNQMLPPVREMATQFGLSHMAAARSLQTLVDEGVLRSVPRVGYFVGAQVKREAGTYLMLAHAPHFWSDAKGIQLKTGFENRISKLGGSSLVMDRETALGFHRQGKLPALAGVFNLTTLDFLSEHHLPDVRVHSQAVRSAAFDSVSFDDFTGGIQATRHLLNQGHRRIALIGLHTPEDGANDLRDREDDGLMWSVERERGWKNALSEAGVYDEALYFHPHQTAMSFDGDHQRQGAYVAALNLCDSLEKLQVTAMIAVSHTACEGLMEAFQQQMVSQSRYPALVSFDNEVEASAQVISALSLPWHDLGRVAADVLWERHHGALQGAPVHRSVPMRLIPRLSCRTDWRELALAS